jgi:hypothetical protein
MSGNESGADRAVRVFAGIAAVFVAVLGLGLLKGEPAGIVVAAVGAVSLVTGLIGFCPAYAILGVGTCPVRK